MVNDIKGIKEKFEKTGDGIGAMKDLSEQVVQGIGKGLMGFFQK